MGAHDRRANRSWFCHRATESDTRVDNCYHRQRIIATKAVPAGIALIILGAVVTVFAAWRYDRVNRQIEEGLSKPIAAWFGCDAADRAPGSRGGGIHVDERLSFELVRALPQIVELVKTEAALPLHSAERLAFPRKSLKILRG